jgi:pyruvate/2-oxoglutarate dehydrogenase complex dihydrolipoamide acyltransferase (E2) component
VQRTVDESGDIVETTLDESGELVDEDIVGNVGDLSSEEEYTNEEGNTVRTVKEETGALISLSIGPDENILDLSLPPQKEEVVEQEVLEEHSETHSQTIEEEPGVTDAARQKAEELGVDLSEVEGSGAGYRITVKDVIGANKG